MNIKKIRFVFAVLILLSQINYSQEQTVDASKPTNLYTQLNAAFEYQSRDGSDLYGTRINVQYAFNPDNLLLLEVPLLYNEGTNKSSLV